MNLFPKRIARASLLLAAFSSPAFLSYRATKGYVSDYENVLGTSVE